MFKYGLIAEEIQKQIQSGEYPADEKALQAIVCGICYDNAVRYFGFEGIGR